MSYQQKTAALSSTKAKYIILSNCSYLLQNKLLTYLQCLNFRYTFKDLEKI